MNRNIIQEKYLILKAKTKDQDAYSKVYNLYAERIYRFIYFKVSSQEEAQDLTSEVFLKTWQYILDGKDIKNLNALFYKVARNLVIDHYRKSSQKDLPLEKEIYQQKELIEDQIEEKIDVQLDFNKLESKIKLLKNEYQEVILLRYVEDLSIKEIAEVLEKKKGNVRVILYRAVNALKELMEEESENQ